MSRLGLKPTHHVMHESLCKVACALGMMRSDVGCCTTTTIDLSMTHQVVAPVSCDSKLFFVLTLCEQGGLKASPDRPAVASGGSIVRLLACSNARPLRIRRLPGTLTNAVAVPAITCTTCGVLEG